MQYKGFIYLDKEKDIIIDFYSQKDRYFYILRTPNHHSGNLISNLAKLCNLDIAYDENGLKIIKGEIPSFLNEQNERIYILKFNKKTIAVISDKGKIMRRATMPAIPKTLMSQTKDYKLSYQQTFVRTYVEEKYKTRTDVHTHMNACLYPDILIALGIYHQIEYPYYYVLKLGLKLTKAQESKLLKQREKVAKKYQNSELVGKYKERKINDNTVINFADLILNNIENAKYNIDHIRASLSLMKDGQAVFTNLEKLYLYRYVFTKGKDSTHKIKLKNINKLPDDDIQNYLNRMLIDSKNELYKNNNLFEDKLLWIGRMYQTQGIKYVEISNTTLVKNSEENIKAIESIHHILPLIEKETGVTIRFLAALRRIPLTIVKDNITPENYLRENLDVLKAVGKDPYIVGCDFVGEEINEIRELKPVLKEIVDYCKDNPYFTIRIHAGENDSIRNNVSDSIRCIKESLNKGQKMPVVRLGHGLYTPSLKTYEGKNLLKDLKENNIFLEFQLTSNVRLNNLNDFESHPLKEYLKNNIRCLQGSDGCGIYGSDSLDEELALINLLNINRNELKKMINTEKEVMEIAKKAYKIKTKNFDKLRNGRSVRETILSLIEKNKNEALTIKLNTVNKLDSKEVLKDQLKVFPLDKTPIVLVGGSFNSNKQTYKLLQSEKELINTLLTKLSPKKFFFVVGDKISGYEKYLIDNKGKFEVYAIIPSDINEAERRKLVKANIPIRVSTESLGMGIYKSFNYWLFEQRTSVVIAIEGGAAAANLVQEAKNGKAKALVYVSSNSKTLTQKAESLKGYVNVYQDDKSVQQMIKNIKKTI